MDFLNKYRVYIAALVIVFFLFLLKVAAFYTNTVEFCTSCHSMSFAHDEYKKSRHFMSPSGVRAGCSDCHVGRGVKRVRVFAQLIPDAWAELMNPIRDKADWEKRKPGLAKEVREEMLKCKSSKCLGCHNPESLRPDNERKRNAHNRIKGEGKSCIECHKNLVHGDVL